MEITWRSLQPQGDKFYVSGYVQSDGEMLTGAYVLVGQVVEQKAEDWHETQVLEVTITDERGYFELSAPRKSKLRLYVAMIGMMTPEYDISRLVK